MEESAILGLVKRYATRIFSIGELAREAAFPEAVAKDAVESLVAQGLLTRTFRGNYCLPPDAGTENHQVGPEIVCPFCHFRRAFAPAESPSLFSPLARIVVYHCPCGAAASPSADAVYGRGYDLEEVEQALARDVLGADPNECRVDLTHIAHINPPILLLWVKQVHRDSGR
jgi:hypothetical protein